MFLNSALRGCVIFVTAVIAASVVANAHADVIHRVVSLEWAAAQDKPVAPLVLSDSQQSLDWYQEKELKRFKHYVIHCHVVPKQP